MEERNASGFKFLIGSRFLRSASFLYMLLAAPLYLLALHLSIIGIGIVYTGVLLFSALISVLLGGLGDRIGYKKALIIADIIPAASALTLFLTSNVYAIIAAMVLGGIGGAAIGVRGAFSPGTTALIANNYRSESSRRNKINLLTSTAGAASIIGAAMVASHGYFAAYLGDAGAYRILYLVAGACMLLSTLFLLFIKENKRPAKSTRIMRRASMSYTRKILLLNAINGAGAGLIMPLLPLWFATVFKANAFQIGIVFGISYAVLSVASYAASKMRFIDPLRTATITRVWQGAAFILMGAPVLLVAYLHAWITVGFIAAIVCYIAAIVSTSMGVGTRLAIAVRGLHKEDYGTATSLQSITSNVSMSATTVLAGYLIGAAAAVPMFGGGVLFIINGVLYGKLLR